MAQDEPVASQTDTLVPIPSGNRVFTLLTYIMMWWASLIVIQAFVLGQSFLPPIGTLNLFQALFVLVIVGAIFVIGFSLNGQAGMKYGIPYSVQARSSFGLRGSKIVELLRIIPAIVWYGIGTWIAALSLDGILTTITGFTTPWIKYAYFLGLQALQTWLAWSGIRTMKWFNAISSIVIAIVMAYMFVHIMSSSPIELADSWTAEGDWGPAFWIAMTGAIGALATVMLNISDMTRHLQVSQKNLWVGHLLGVLPPWFFMLSLGIVAGATIGVWNPVDALMQLSPHPAAMIVLLTFILLAQFTTNLTINVLPPALVFMDMFKISWERAVLATGVLGVLSFPWLLLSNSEAFFGFILYYSAFFGPILGVMLADYYVIRRRTLDVPAHYETGEGATFWYGGGFNIAGLIAVFLPGTIAMIWFLPMAWTIGLPSGFVIYLALFGRLHGVTRSGDFNTNPSGT